MAKLSKPTTLTASRLRELMHYDPESGIFTWLVDRGNLRCAGKKVGAAGTRGILLTRVDYRTYSLHRLAWLYMTGKWPAGLVDHRNGIAGDNRWCNLRLADNNQNAFNTMDRGTNKTGFRGVKFIKKTGRFEAMLKVRGRSVWCGAHDTAEAAHQAYRAATAVHHGEYAWHHRER